MRRADGDEDAGFANLQAAQTVHHANAVDRVFFMEELPNFFHFSQSHGFISLVVEVKSGSAMGLVANETVEGDDGAILVGADFAHERRNIDGLLYQGEAVIFGEGI